MGNTALFQSFGPFFNAGSLVGGARIYHYVVGTTTTQACWTDRTKLTTAAQPLVADSNGIASAYFDGLYKIVVKTADDSTTLATWDQVQLLDLVPYTKNTWIPTLSCLIPGNLAVSYTDQTGYYEVCGNRVTAWFSIVTSAFTYTTAAGPIFIKTLPFAGTGDLNPWVNGGLIWGGMTKANYTAVVPYVAGVSFNIGLYGSGSGQPAVILGITDFPSGGTVQLQGCVTYIYAGS